MESLIGRAREKTPNFCLRILGAGVDMRWSLLQDANYPGSIVFGGLDFAKQSQTFIRGDLDTDGIPQLDVTGINVHAEHAVYDIMGGLGVGTYDAEIDVSSPWIYVPQVAAGTCQ